MPLVAARCSDLHGVVDGVPYMDVFLADVPHRVPEGVDDDIAVSESVTPYRLFGHSAPCHGVRLRHHDAVLPHDISLRGAGREEHQPE